MIFKKLGGSNLEVANRAKFMINIFYMSFFATFASFAMLRKDPPKKF